MRELTACGSCEFVWLDSFDSFIVAAVAEGDAIDAGAGAGKDTGNGHGNGAAAAHVCPKYKKAILAAALPTPAAVAFSGVGWESGGQDCALFMALCAWLQLIAFGLGLPKRIADLQLPCVSSVSCVSFVCG